MSAHAYAASRAAAQLSLFGRLLRRRNHATRLDVAGLPDHLKRDLGFLSGPDRTPRNIFRD